MKFEEIDVISPVLFPTEQWNEAEVFGAITWLWLASEHLKRSTLSEMAHRVIPVIKSRQFAIFTQGYQPLGYICWANLDPNSEANYVHSEPWIYTHPDWNCGDRMWILTWLSLPNHSHKFKTIIENHLFPNQCFRALYHKGDVQGLKILNFKGKLLSTEQMKQWMVERPILAKQI